MGRRKNPYARPDAKTRAAKAAGYPARSVFKLREIDERVKLFRLGMHVLDLGAAPGSWALYASQRVGPAGRVVAVDLAPIAGISSSNLQLLECDVLTTDAGAFAASAPYDLVLSDMAPSTSGSKVRDQALSFELFMRALELAVQLGRPGGNFVGKLFMSGDFARARSALSTHFVGSKVIRPEGTRQQSSELFLIGSGLRAASAS